VTFWVTTSGRTAAPWMIVYFAFSRSDLLFLANSSGKRPLACRRQGATASMAP
jgi:hypothetical protein